MSQWIDIKQRMPEDGEWINVKYQTGEEAQGYHYSNYLTAGWITKRKDGYGAFNHVWSGLHVKYWRPLD
jgi:hypothetical protein